MKRSSSRHTGPYPTTYHHSGGMQTSQILAEIGEDLGFTCKYDRFDRASDESKRGSCDLHARMGSQVP